MIRCLIHIEAILMLVAMWYIVYLYSICQFARDHTSPLEKYNSLLVYLVSLSLQYLYVEFLLR